MKMTMIKTKIKDKFSKFLKLLLPAIVILYSCKGLNNEYVDLGSNYWYKNTGGGVKLIESKSMPFYKQVYPEVVDYAFDESFIIAKQRYKDDLVSQLMGENFLRRFGNYSKFLSDVTTYQTVYKNNGHLLQQDSMLYTRFLKFGRTDDESKNRSTAILLATEDKGNSSKHDEYYYWIISKTTDSVIGPLAKAEYLVVRQSVNVSPKLIFKDDR